MDSDGTQSVYVWILICGVVSAFLMAYGIGANDVANTFATSVGAGSLTFRQAVILATVCETIGATFLGANVAKTVRKGIIDEDFFNQAPEVFMLGMCCALFAAGLWLILCSSRGLPVSTTHSIVGAIMGIGLSINPNRVVQWKTVGEIVLSWFISPILSGLLAALFFIAFRKFIMRVKNGHLRAFYSYPALLLLLVLSVAVSFTLKIPFKALRDKVKENKGAATGIAVAVSLAITLVVFAATYKWVKRKIAGAPDTLDSLSTSSVDGCEMKQSDSTQAGTETPNFQRDEIESDEQVHELHAVVEKFPPKTEEVYNYLLVVAACFSSIAHGANDVANAIGPFVAIYSIYQERKIEKEAQMHWWISLAGGIAISIGLLTYGYKVLSTMSMKLCSITPSRGFSIELGGAWVIIAGSFWEFPLSTTHCKVGATIGVGLCESPQPWKFKGVNISLLGKVMVGWVTTLLFTAGLSVCLFTLISAAVFPRNKQSLIDTSQ